MLKLSIIVPVYNVEPFLERCLSSLVEQDIIEDEYEIIVINDGSTDNSRDIVFEYQKTRSNILFIEQTNKGVSSARNTGLENASGEYVLFIDPDDYINRNSVLKHYQISVNERLDILYAGFEKWDLTGNYIGSNDYSHLEGKILTGIEAYRSTRGHNLKTPDRSVGIFIKKAFLSLNNLQYLPEISYLEDGHFIGKILCLAKRCGFSNKPFYKNTMRIGSASTSKGEVSEKGINGFIAGAIDFNVFKDSFHPDCSQNELLNHLKAKYVLSAVMHAVSAKNLKILNSTYIKLKINELLRLDLSGLIGLKKYAQMLNISFWLFVFYFIIESRWEKAKRALRRKF